VAKKLTSTNPRVKSKTSRQRRTSREKIAATLAEIDQIKPATPQAARAIALVRSWLVDESGYDEETWPQLKRALNRERARVGARRLFHG
jgi:hypothetical protein